MADTLLQHTEQPPIQPPASEVAEPERRSPQSTKSSWLGKILWPLLLVAAFAAGWIISGGGIGHREKEALPPEKGAAARDSSEVMVTVEPVSHRPVQRTVEAVGTLHGFEEVTISARVEGRVRKLHHDVSDRVEPGEALLQIDPIDAELSVQQAERALLVELAKVGLTEPPTSTVDLEKVPSVMQAQTRQENARSRHDRARRLASSRVLSAEDVETASSDFRAAQAEHANQLLVARAALATVRMKQSALAVARQQLADTRVTAPTPTLPVPGGEGVAYVITQRTVAEGTFVRPGTELFKLVINRTLKLRVPVPERYSREIRQGQKAAVTVASAPTPFPGTVARINPAVDPATRTFEVEIQVSNASGDLKPGSFAKAAILTRLDQEAVTVPLSAVVQFAGITKVFVAEKGRAKEIPVTLGVQNATWVEIARPALPRGAFVVTSGQTAIANDTPVSVRDGGNKESGPRGVSIVSKP